MADKNIRINRSIRVKEVRLIDADGNQMGVISTTEAMNMAENSGLDLVEVAPTARPPVCKILDFGKYKYEQDKRLRESKKKQTLVKLKEIRMQPKIEKHDMEFKTKHIYDFLNEGFKVKVTIRFRGRELAHTERGRDVLLRILDKLRSMEYEFNVDRPPQMEGRFMSMFLSSKIRK